MTEITTITPASPMGGDYPFLKRLDVDWQLDSIPLDEQLRGAMFDSTQSFGYVRAEGYTRFRVPGWEANRMGQFARDQLRLRLDPARKGIYTLSKRISRINRPYRLYSFFRADEMVIRVDPTLDCQTWDGAGRISRGFLRTMLERVPADYRQWATCEVERTRRWEFTVMTQRGQYKGHCLVIDDQFEDLVLPDDCKTELGLIDPEVFIGLVPVHSADHMRLDTQSLINLHPFFDVETLMGWLGEASAVVLDDMASGRADRAFALMAVDDDSPWHVPAFVQSGGNPRWFAGILRGMTSGYLNSLRKSAVEGLRLPIPGGRYYVAVDVVGGYEVPSGHIKLDPHHGTAWVNHDDWHRMLAARWGGADQDDPLWCMPFTDYDGSRKVLAWRSPNQAGEYALLTPTNDSHEIVWHTVDGEYCWPELDSRRLPSPIETMGTRYLNLVDEDDVLPAPDRYGLAALRPAVERAFENDAVLGTYCNRLMLTTALSNIETETLPCRLETIIDAQVKTGAPLGVVMMDCEQWAVGFAARNPIPESLAARIAPSVGEHITLSQDHWLDQLVCDIETHIDEVTAASEVMASQSLPPVEVLQTGMSHIREGAKLRSIYGRAFSRTDQRTRTQYEQARRDTESYLHSFSPETQSRVLLGAVVQAYLVASDAQTDDAVVWQRGAVRSDRGRDEGLAEMTLAALRDLGVIGERVTTTAGDVLHYTGRSPHGIGLRLDYVWYNLGVASGVIPSGTRMGDVSATVREPLQKHRVPQLLTTMIAKRYPVRIQYNDSGRGIAYGMSDSVIGYLPKHVCVEPGTYRLTLADTVGDRVLAVVEAH